MFGRNRKLATRLTLEAPQRATDGGGGWVVTWTPLGTVWADLQPGRGREGEAGEREIARVTHRITIRSAPVGSSRRPVADQRFRLGDRVFAIRAIAEADDRGAYLTCWAEEGPFA